MPSLISLAIPTIIISNTSGAYIYNEARTEVNGENASAHTQIITNVNGVETKVESDQPGTVKLEVKDGIATGAVSPTVSPTPEITELTPKITVAEEIPIQASLWVQIRDWLSGVFRFLKIRT